MSNPYLVICSVGNPGARYAYTRHNMGHIVLDKIREYLGFHSWTRSPSLKNCVVSGSPSYPVILYKSETQMNISGGSISRNWQILRRQKLSEGYDPVLVIINDELSLPVGKSQVRLKNSSPRGHNGLKSIRTAMGGNFLSISVGIGRPESRDQNSISNYVLSRIPTHELQSVYEDVVIDVCGYLEQMLEGNYIDD